MIEAQDKFTRSEHTEEQQLNPLQSEAFAELSSQARTSDPRAASKMDGIFTVDSGVTKAQLQHAEAIVNALPTDIQQALLDGNVNIELTAGWHKGLPQG